MLTESKPRKHKQSAQESRYSSWNCQKVLKDWDKESKLRGETCTTNSQNTRKKKQVLHRTLAENPYWHIGVQDSPRRTGLPKDPKGRSSLQLRGKHHGKVLHLARDPMHPKIHWIAGITDDTGHGLEKPLDWKKHECCMGWIHHVEIGISGCNPQ
jgi:hypothetical protein